LPDWAANIKSQLVQKYKIIINSWSPSPRFYPQRQGESCGEGNNSFSEIAKKRISTQYESDEEFQSSVAIGKRIDLFDWMTSSMICRDGVTSVGCAIYDQ
jgi:hypothetical protein